jgi:hypothetical protein
LDACNWKGAVVPHDPKTLSMDKLAKYGHFDELRRRVAAGEKLNLVQVFERAVTDFRTVPRGPGHHRILRWCLDQGLDLCARVGWLNQPVVCLAAAAGNSEIVETMMHRGLPDDPFIRASVGDAAFLKNHGSRHKLAEVLDRNGFNPLFYCAASALGRHDEAVKARLSRTCEFLIDQGVNPAHEVQAELPIFPAFLCAATGGNEEAMLLLLQHDGVSTERFHQVLEHALEPHQRSGEPFYHIAELLVRRGFDINSPSINQRRTLLHAAANRGLIRAVAWLLQNGADPNALDERGRNPLHVCAERNTSASVARLLIGAGSDPNVRDVEGKLPIDHARAHDREKVVEYLKGCA